MNRSFHRLPLAAAFLPLAAILTMHAARAQSSFGTDVSTLKVNARIVVLDVTVTNKNGHLVNNLSQNDLTVLEDKVPQSILSFEAPAAHSMPGAKPDSRST